ncbi:FAD-dependent oxidoreductase [Haliea sp. E1-2-M8]|uniref:FAD-dependent oxidoreductase n=1 Tax=Haliea sp. E1-2-M8 TaxID=3064706 RepID=UPI002720E7BC|nr:FAD-dependent oxidoreductase [Haliea sp. E1-2-M8]MDO8863615.1 FAD-dependent oxidoreductase [Haliea sp. E1-2-M8]
MKIAITKRDLLRASSGAALLAATGKSLARRPGQRTEGWDLIVVGGGNAGMPAAIFAAERGAKVLVIEAASALGGTLYLSSGQMSAAGTKLQQAKGIEDSPELHYADIMRISKSTANPALARLATDNAGRTFDWLMENGFEVHPQHPVEGTTHEPYSVARYAWGKEGGRSILKVLNQELAPHLESGLVTTLLETRATDLITDDKDNVLGVKTSSADGSQDHYGDNVVLTAGGYASNDRLFEELEGTSRACVCSYPNSQGAGIGLGLSVGGYLRGAENHLPLFGGVFASDDYPSPLIGTHRPLPPHTMPWGIYVNAQGRRFMAEDVPSHDAHEVALGEQSNERCWLVFDDEMINKMESFIGRWTREDAMKAFDSGQAFFFKAESPAELARKANINIDGLSETIEEYNAGREHGNDRYGRKHMPLPLQKAPFYAIQLQGWLLTSFAGLAVNEDLQVIRKDGSGIPNLYAAGELLGTGNLSGKAYCGGMLVTPALTFGRLLGQKILKFA